MLFAEKKIRHGCAQVTSKQQTSQTALESLVAGFFLFMDRPRSDGNM